MGDFWSRIPEHIQRFVEAQQIFFVATAPTNGRVNLSPKGMDCFRVIDSGTVAYIDVTGSGNETAAHVTENGRITFMFCAMSGDALIARLYGKARLVLPESAEWPEWQARFPHYAAVRQIFVASIESVGTSCGWGVPIYEMKAERGTWGEWVKKMGPANLETFKADYNTFSIDGLPTGTVPEDF